MSDFNLTRDVIEPGYCIGCGICKVSAPQSISIEFNNRGFYEPVIGAPISPSEMQTIGETCPFSRESTNETDLGKTLFGEGANYDEKLGFVRNTYAIRVQQGTIRENATSAGFTTWILCELLDKKLVDAVIHVGISPDVNPDFPNFGYLVSSTTEEVQSRSKTRYYPVQAGSVLSSIQDDSRRFVIVGLPCFIKAVQNLKKISPIWEKKIPFTVSLFCGHLKSKLFTENLLNAMVGTNEEILQIDYRRKKPNKPANNYLFGVLQAQGWKDRNMASITASDWGSGSFKYYACNLCDDVVGETSDVSVGDAWLPQYREDGGGTNNVVTRNPVIDTLINKAHNEDRLWLESLTLEEVHQSTKGGFEDRREGTAFRWHMEHLAGNNPPPKRFVSPTMTKGIRSETFALKVLIGMMTPPLFCILSKLRGQKLFRMIMSPICSAYRRRFPGVLFRMGFFSKIVVALRKL